MKQLDLISPTSEQFCCGTTCPRKEVQDRIDRMQSIIDELRRSFNEHNGSFDGAEIDMEELEKLSTK